MKSLLLIGAMIVATGTCAFAQGGYWVVGNRATSKCEIVTSNPVINAQVGGNIWFGSGPYQSLYGAKLARSTIRGSLAGKNRPQRRRMTRTNPTRAVFEPFASRNASTQNALMYGVAAAGHAVEAYRRVELRQFGLKLLVYP
jgi:hypothetical protein